MIHKVLVVDDDPLVLDVTAQMLEELGCEVVMTTNPRLALDLLAGNDFEILITDINMPEMSGYELAGRARRRRQNLGVRGDVVVPPRDRRPRLPDDSKAVPAGGSDAHHGADDRALLSSRPCRLMPVEPGKTQ